MAGSGAVALEPPDTQAKRQPSPDGSRLLRVGDDSIAILDVRSAISGRARTERTEVLPFPDLGENLEIRNTTYQHLSR